MIDTPEWEEVVERLTDMYEVVEVVQILEDGEDDLHMDDFCEKYYDLVMNNLDKLGVK